MRKLVSAVICITAMSAVVFAGNVKEWNVGSGQVNGNFTVNNHSVSDGSELLYELELGLRPQERYVGASYAPNIDSSSSPIKGVYEVQSGWLTWGAIWNFDMSVYVSGVDGQATQSINDLQSLTLSLNLNEGFGEVVYDMLNADFHNWYDAHTYDYIQGTANPTNFYQGSENIISLQLPTFDPDATGTYSFVLSAIDAVGDEYAVAMDVVAVPEPASIALLSVGAVLFRRKK